jgi:hypothetical protein
MSNRTTSMLVAAASLTSAALIVPASGLAAQNWTSVTHNNMPTVQGSGRVTRQNRAVGPFQRIEMMGAEVVDVRLGARPSVVIAADDNVLPLLTSEVRNGTLKLASRGSYRIRGPVRVWVTVPNLESFVSSGSGDVTIHGVNNPRMKLTINGSGSMQATGRTDNLDLNINGSGTAQLAGLAARNVNAGLHGSGNATVRASGLLDARVIGSGNLRYIGRPARVRPTRVGSGRIIAGS